MVKKLLAIINPISGTTKKKQIVDYFTNHIDRQQFEFKIVLTEYAGHASELVKWAIEHTYDYVIAVGGDGTINEVARSVIGSSLTMGIIPCGSGNGLARHLQIPLDMKLAIDVINEQHVECIDFGKINEIPFFCTCGVGFDAFVSLKFARSKKRGILSYLENTLREYLKYKPNTYTVRTGNNTQQYKAFLIACANASQYGNNAYIAPNASLTDGLMDVTILEPFTFMDVPALSFQLFSKHIDKNKHIKTFKCKELFIDLEHPSVIHFDGDPMEVEGPLKVELIEKGLNILVPTHPTNSKSIFVKTIDYFSNINVLSDLR